MNASVNKTIICSNNGMSPIQHQTIMTIYCQLTKPLVTNLREVWFKLQQFLLKKMNLKMGPAKWRPVCLNVLSPVYYLNQSCLMDEPWNNVRLQVSQNDIKYVRYVTLFFKKKIVFSIFHHMGKSRNHFVNAPSQWQATLHCNVVSHCLGTYPKRSPNLPPLQRIKMISRLLASMYFAVKCNWKS